MRSVITPVMRCLPLLFLLLPVVARARVKADTLQTNQGVEIFIKNNRAFRLKMIIEAHLFDGESSLSDFGRIGTGVSADYIFRRFLSVHGSYSGGYFSVLKNNAKQQSFTENRLKGFSVGEAGIRLHVLDGKGWARRKMMLQSFKEPDEHGRERTIVRSVKARFPCRRIVALRGGVYYSTSPFGANVNTDLSKLIESNSPVGSVTATDGTVFTGDYYSNTTTTGIYAGLTKIVNMKFMASSTIEWLEGESKLTALFKENYIDVIFANTTIDPFMIKGKQFPIDVNAKGSVSLNNIGWRVGGRVIATEKPVTTSATYEMGVRPGLATRGAYVRIGINITYQK